MTDLIELTGITKVLKGQKEPRTILAGVDLSVRKHPWRGYELVGDEARLDAERCDEGFGIVERTFVAELKLLRDGAEKKLRRAGPGVREFLNEAFAGPGEPQFALQLADLGTQSCDNFCFRRRRVFGIGGVVFGWFWCVRRHTDQG